MESFPPFRRNFYCKSIFRRPPTNNPNGTYGDGTSPFNYLYPPGFSLGSIGYTDGSTGVGVDTYGNVFISFKNGMSDVWRFPAPIPDIGTLSPGEVHSIDVDVFKQDQYHVVNKVGPSNIQAGVGVVVAENMPTHQLIVADQARLMYWNIPSGPQALTNGQAANGFVVNPQTTPPPFNHDDGSFFGRPKVDQATDDGTANGAPRQHLWISISGVMRIYNLPLQGGDVPLAQLPNSIPVLNGGGSQVDMSIGDMIPSWDAGVSYLWVADIAHGRVMRIRQPLDPLNRVVDIILGQNDANNNDCGNHGTNNGSGCVEGTPQRLYFK